MTTFLFAFGLLVLIVLGMSLGVIFMRKPITGSCGGLNAISDADHCLVCNAPVDPNSPLKEKLECPRKKAAREKAERLASEATA
ncbi:(Na+)-NQR maturation NqrM [Cohaesibacter gelatinilyticus]|uniref:(Na+)-NQR maturation NqrM n=1 Tax=Cohaesibacter gelatinilyticus TaxID=372072 RepID=A0A285NC34_9HYPH|nr:(Na+)-NQR maturation NqrM [Cohaesibacter gelatinilyticus]SNZ06497.1 hypothetical protein SAMN06265368_0440 [Cohaesibacter gelatinilyticus]